MKTLFTICAIAYLVIVSFIMLSRKMNENTVDLSKESNENDCNWIKDNNDRHKWMNFASGLSDTPSSEIPNRLIKKR